MSKSPPASLLAVAPTALTIVAAEAVEANAKIAIVANTVARNLILISPVIVRFNYAWAEKRYFSTACWIYVSHESIKF